MGVGAGRADPCRVTAGVASAARCQFKSAPASPARRAMLTLTVRRERRPPLGRYRVAPHCADCTESGRDQRSPSDEKRCRGEQQPAFPLVSRGARRGQTFGAGKHIGSGGPDGALRRQGTQGQSQACRFLASGLIDERVWSRTRQPRSSVRLDTPYLWEFPNSAGRSHNSARPARSTCRGRGVLAGRVRQLLEHQSQGRWVRCTRTPGRASR